MYYKYYYVVVFGCRRGNRGVWPVCGGFWSGQINGPAARISGKGRAEKAYIKYGGRQILHNGIAAESSTLFRTLFIIILYKIPSTRIFIHNVFGTVTFSANKFAGESAPKEFFGESLRQSFYRPTYIRYYFLSCFRRRRRGPAGASAQWPENAPAARP